MSPASEEIPREGAGTHKPVHHGRTTEWSIDVTTQQVDAAMVQQKRELAMQFVGGLFNAGAVHIGNQLGLYEAMDGRGPVSSHELAELTNLDERFLREWLYQQAAAEVLEYRGDGRF